MILVLALTALASAQGSQELQAANPPPRGAWVDSLDLDRVMGRHAPPGYAMARVQGPANLPPPGPPRITLDGISYAHGLGVTSNAELWIDLRSKAERFLAVVGIDDVRKSGRGSVSFEVWIDGKKRFGTGVLRAGQPARPIAVDVTGGKTMILLVGDGGDGTTGDVADWAG